MGQQQTVALMGDVEELAAKQAALLLAALRDLAGQQNYFEGRSHTLQRF